jgi:hypothetical protein
MRKPTPDALLPPDTSTGFAPGDVVGGYRLVRLIGSGDSAEIYLGQAIQAADVAEQRTAAVKVYRASAGDDRIATEIAALTRARHPHALALRDLATTPRGQPCLVLERLSGGGLARLLRERSSLTRGEAVTVLAPLAEALDALHGSGVVHGAVRMRSVAFRESGAPVLLGLGHAVMFERGASPAALSSNTGVVADRIAFARLAAAVLARVPGESAARLADALLVDETPGRDGSAPSVADLLFDLAEPEPVRLPRQSGSHLNRPELDGPELELSELDDDGVRTTGTEAMPISAPAPLAAVRRRAPPTGRVQNVVDAAKEHAKSIRPRFWVAAGCVAVSLVVAVAVVPQGSGNAESSGHPVAGPTDGIASLTATPEPLPPEPPPADAASGGDGVTAGDPLLADDPVAAVGVLLDEREQCLHELSIGCLEGVVQAGSAALAADTALIESISNGGEIPPGASIVAGELTLVERLGDSAIVGLGPGPETTTASALVMRAEAGWRIRAYLPP